ncbi:DUF4277 domain-containing protein [Marispirochaeta sp.]|uniref:IS1634 family transposase n=1 Tax=Marispirochaeta sp. TaxID=2038653 RepID=UPI0029C9100B|nr:DUF4277 domain-containing protein [Marispirochaeta sp.]
MKSGANVSISRIDHLGLVAGMCEKIGLVDTINSYIKKPQRKVSVGNAVKAMVLNGLGVTGRALYHTPEFFRRKAVDTLVGSGIRAKDLHDDSLGTALDALYDEGITELFYNIAAKALKTQGIEYRFVHLDSTTFSLHGEYSDESSEHEQVVTITKGRSKDRAPDLNQVVTTLMCSHRSTIRWVLQFFVDLSIIHLGESPPQAANLDDRHITVIESLDEEYEKIYFLR